jgi:Mrp family chromosome partitioning ATPase
MTDWLRPIEQMVLACSRDRRIIGITAPHAAAGVSTVSSAFAEVSARWGANTLLVDLSQEASSTQTAQLWAPGLGDPKLYLTQREYSYDYLQAVPNSANIGFFNSARNFRTSLVDELKEYSAIVLDLPAILDSSARTINPAISAVSCDGVIVVCRKGRTTTDQLKKTVEIIQAAGAALVGTVLNDIGPRS